MTKDVANSFMQITFTVVCAKAKPIHEQNKACIKKRWETYVALMKDHNIEISPYSDDTQRTVKKIPKHVLMYFSISGVTAASCSHTEIKSIDALFEQMMMIYQYQGMKAYVPMYNSSTQPTNIANTIPGVSAQVRNFLDRYIALEIEEGANFALLAMMEPTKLKPLEAKNFSRSTLHSSKDRHPQWGSYRQVQQ